MIQRNGGASVDGGKLESGRKSAEFERTEEMRLILAILLSWLGGAWLVLAASENGSSEGSRSVAQELRAHTFVVVDDKGEKQCEFGKLERGEIGMVIWNKKKTAAVSVSIDRFGMPRIAFENSKSNAVLQIGVLDDDHPAFVLSDGDGRRRLGMVVAEKGEVSIGLYDTDKRKRLSLTLGKHGDPRVLLRDRQGVIRARLMVDDTDTVALDLLDPKGQPHIVLQVDSEGQADSAVIGADGQPIWSANKLAPKQGGQPKGEHGRTGGQSDVRH